MRVRSVAFAFSFSLIPFAAHAATIGGYLAVDGINPPAAQTASSGSGGWTPTVGAGTDGSWMPLITFQISLPTGPAPVTRVQDAASPQLALAAQDGRAYNMFLDVQAADGSQIVYQLWGATITNYTSTQVNGQGQESFSIKFRAWAMVDKASQPVINGRASQIPVLTRSIQTAQTPATTPPASTTHPVSATLHTPWAP